MGIAALSRGAIFLDRDGVLNPLVPNPVTGRWESPLRVEDFHLAAGAAAALLRLRQAGYPLILVSNQPNYALGKSSRGDLDAIHEKLMAELEAIGIRFTRVYYCLHHPRWVRLGYSGLCACRKPSPWFLLQASDDLGLDLAASWMIGDQGTDTRCGRAAGAHTIRIVGFADAKLRPAVVDPCAEFSAVDLSAAADLILSEQHAERSVARTPSEPEHEVSADGAWPRLPFTG
jgi:D-glycero-D-manno-heptose 1,7-bisphosphate phosphatase